MIQSEKPGKDAEKPGNKNMEEIDIDELIKAQEAQDRGKSLQMKQACFQVFLGSNCPCVIDKMFAFLINFLPSNHLKMTHLGH